MQYPMPLVASLVALNAYKVAVNASSNLLIRAIASTNWHRFAFGASAGRTILRLGMYAFLVTISALSGCASTTDTQPTLLPFAGLGGSEWRLVEFQSMDDAQGVTRPADPARYTLAFASDGALSARLDCNRGMGTWRNDLANATGGTLVFGPMAVTKVLCPEPTMGEWLERQLPNVRNFTIRDGKMHMALMADGGIIVWEPVKKST